MEPRMPTGAEKLIQCLEREGVEYIFGYSGGAAMPIFDALRPEGPRDEGFVHAGKVGAGHYTKMVHNGIEYGLMAAYAEGYERRGSRGSCW